jgi:hypothetical protein
MLSSLVGLVPLRCTAELEVPITKPRISIADSKNAFAICVVLEGLETAEP